MRKILVIHCYWCFLLKIITLEVVSKGFNHDYRTDMLSRLRIDYSPGFPMTAKTGKKARPFRPGSDLGEKRTQRGCQSPRGRQSHWFRLLLQTGTECLFFSSPFRSFFSFQLYFYSGIHFKLSMNSTNIYFL